VLLVNDHDDSAEMYAIGLLWTGFHPVKAASAEEAFARACQIRPDIIVADLTPAGAANFSLARRLRGDRRTAHAGIIVLMGHARGSTCQDASDAGCDRFLLKPCLPDVLALEVRDVLNHRADAK
jgi:DNA-binding response OmpR family regulator